MLKVCCLDHKMRWTDVLPIMKFAYNNSNQITIQIALHETFYGRKYRSSLYWDEIGEKDELAKALRPKLKDSLV